MPDAMQLTDFDPHAFLAEYWQKRPLLIRSPWRTWQNPLAPEQLAGLACEEGVEARLVVDKRRGKTVRYGPFKPSRFTKLGKRPWTLLVQGVDRVVPRVAALIEPFRFVPDWRIDDVMVSYASDGGGVGPHFDRYDVFLLQGLGQRRWRIGGACDAKTALLPHDQLCLLEEFEAVEEWVLDPGDMLYLPPGIAHDGIAVGDDCMTYSVGFRAPSTRALVAHWCDDVVSRLTEDERYVDPDLIVQADPGEITAAALDRLHALVMAAVGDRAAFARWFGTFASAPREGEVDESGDPLDTVALCARFAPGKQACRNPASPALFIEQDDKSILCLADGQSARCERDGGVSP